MSLMVLLMIVFGVVALSAGFVIGLHIKVVAQSGTYVGLLPWHVTCLAIALLSYAGSYLLLVSAPIMSVALFLFASVMSLAAFGIVIENLRKRANANKP